MLGFNLLVIFLKNQLNSILKTKKIINTLNYNKKGGKRLMKLAENFILKPKKNQQIILGCL
ncbi:MAG: hypothetical protein R6V14_09640, partial [Halanaerobiales bacterium]